MMEPARVSVDKGSGVTDEEQPDHKSNSDPGSSKSDKKSGESSVRGVLRWLSHAAVDPRESVLCSGEAQSESNAEFIKRKRKHDLVVPNTSDDTTKSPSQTLDQQSFVKSRKRQFSPASPFPSLRSKIDSENCSELIPQNALNSVNQLGFHENDSSKTLLKDPCIQSSTMNRKKPHEKGPSTADSDTNDSGRLISNEKVSRTVKEGHSLVTQTFDSPKSFDRDVSPLVRPDESVSSSYPSGPTKSQKHQTPRKQTGLLSSIRSELPRVSTPVGAKFQAEVSDSTRLPKFNDLPNVDLDDSKRLGKKPMDIPIIFDDEYPRMALPVGPRFQAEVQDWTGSLKMTNSSDNGGNLNDSKWLGTKIWPVGGADIGTSTETIGKRRRHPCSCESPGSTECTNHHIMKERNRLKSELGPAFFKWKFDEMGEQVSLSWTQEEQKRFQNLLNRYPMSNSKAFWKTAFKCFPRKSREDIVQYYFNVHVLRHISRQTRIDGATVDTDDEDDGETVHKSKHSGSQYLSQLR